MDEGVTWRFLFNGKYYDLCNIHTPSLWVSEVERIWGRLETGYCITCENDRRYIEDRDRYPLWTRAGTYRGQKTI